MELATALQELQEIYTRFNEVQDRLLEARIHKQEAIHELANPNALPGPRDMPGMPVQNAHHSLDELSGLTEEMVERIETLADVFSSQGAAGRGQLEKVDHLCVSIRLYNQMVQSNSLHHTSQTKATKLAGTQTPPEDKLQSLLAKRDAPINIYYTLDPNQSDEEPDVFRLRLTENPDEAEYISLRSADAGFSVKLSTTPDRLMQKAESLVHHFYSLQDAYGQEAAARGIAVTADMHQMVSELNKDHFNRHNRPHPNITQKSLADFECLSMALRKTAETWQKEGANAGIARWNREKQRMHNFNRVENHSRSWAERVERGQLSSGTSRGRGGTLSLDSL